MAKLSSEYDDIERSHRLYDAGESGHGATSKGVKSRMMEVHGRARWRLVMIPLLVLTSGLAFLTRLGLLASSRGAGSFRPPLRSSSYMHYQQLPVPIPQPDCPTDMSCFRKAAYLSPAKLLAGEGPSSASSGNHTVPRLLHQSWGEKAVPWRMSQWSEQCRMLHPNWQWVLWKDSDNRELVKERFPWFLSTYDSLDSNIKRADAARNLYMFAFGGVYLDFDVECTQPFDGLVGSTVGEDSLANQEQHLTALFGWMGSDHKHPHSIPNDWMAGSPGHPFFLLPISFILHCDSHSNLKPEDETGPVPLRNAILRYKAEFEDRREALESYLVSVLPSAFSASSLANRGKAELTVLEEHVIHPFSWTLGSNNRQGRLCLAYLSTFDPQACKEALAVHENGGYAVAYWTHSWESVEKLDYR